jgi:hypothetical protein
MRDYNKDPLTKEEKTKISEKIREKTALEEKWEEEEMKAAKAAEVTMDAAEVTLKMEPRGTPSTGAPIHHDSEEHAFDEFASRMRRDSGCPWMAALWRVKDGRIYLECCTTWKFPTGDLDASLKHLADNFEQRKAEGQPTPEEPLPIAPFLRDKLNRGPGNAVVARPETDSRSPNTSVPIGPPKGRDE